LTSSGDTKSVSLSEFLREKRIAAGMSQGKVAGILGYTSPQFISNWERGISEPPVDTLKVIAKLYNVPMDELFEVVLKSTIQKVTVDLQQKFKNTN
jgi:transcriptional regulator with XRE-family HTH domain